jgi:hypothetical protein
MTSAAGSTNASALTSFVQPTATVAAVLVGWLLSVLTERRSWKRRKAEQVRDKQLSAAVDALSTIRALLSLGQELQTAVASLGMATNGATGVETQRLLRGPKMDNVEELSQRLSNQVVQLDELVIELRFFGFSAKAIPRIEACANYGRALPAAAHESIRQSTANIEIESYVNSIRSELGELVKAGPSILRK